MKKDKFVNLMNNIKISDESENRILTKCLKLNCEKEKVIMSKRKFITIAVAAVFVLGITAFAASGIISSWSGSSSSKAEYTSLPSAEKVIKDIGYEPILIEKFDNGYTFEEGSVVNNSLDDDGGKSVEKFKSVTFTYCKDKNKILFSQCKYTSEMDSNEELATTYHDVNIYFNEYTNKIVPADYKLTEEDKQAEKNGDLVFSYGSDKVSISGVKGVSWSNGDMHYGLMQIDGELSKDDLIKMAEEVIEYK